MRSVVSEVTEDLMSRINTNIPALQAIHRISRNQEDLALRLERLATGLRINRGRDDPAGLITSEILRSEIRQIEQAIENSSRASNVISTTEGSLNEVSSLLLELQDLVVASANEAAITNEEVTANQLAVDAILSSIDRIARTTTFAGKRLLDGSEAYTLSSVPTTALASIDIFSSRMSPGSTRDVTVRVTQSAQTAQVTFVGATAGSGPNSTSASTVQIQGTLGTELLSFATGTSLSDVRTAINSAKPTTGVSATISSPGVGTVASTLILNSTTVGSDSFVSITPIAGNFVVNGNNNTVIRDEGQDAGVLINGLPTAVQGLRADVRANGLDARIFLKLSFGQTIGSATFTITGGGSIFQLAPKVTLNGQVHVGLNSVSTTELGNPVDGLLYTLRSGSSNDLNSKNFLTAQKVLAAAIEEVASYRGRLGSIQRNQIDTNISSQRVALENVTASESIIRDADMAVEISALTRAQILVQSTSTTLQIANSVPNLILSLLG